MDPIVFFGTIYEFYCTISANFYFYLYYIQEKIEKKEKKKEQLVMHAPKIVVRVFISEKLSTTQRIILNWDIERAFAK